MKQVINRVNAAPRSKAYKQLNKEISDEVWLEIIHEVNNSVRHTRNGVRILITRQARG